MRRFVALIAIGFLLPGLVSAAALSDLQIQLQSLLTQLSTFQIQREAMLSAAGAVTTAQCPNLSRNLSRGMRGNDVTQLQQFLISQNHLAADSATGFFGRLTEAAVKKFQCKEMGICSGTPSTTGYGVVGRMTRAAIARMCAGTTASPAPPPPTTPDMSTPPLPPVITPPVVPPLSTPPTLPVPPASPVVTEQPNPVTTNPIDSHAIPSRIIFEEHFGTSLAPDTWMVEGWAGYTQPITVSSGDYALKLTGNARYDTGVRTTWPFLRGGNLTATFKVWHGATFDYNTVSGPWLSTPSAHKFGTDYPFLHQVEAGLAGQENGPTKANHITWGEGSALWSWQKPNTNFLDAWLTATSKDTALIVRIQLGDTTGARMSWSRDGATFYVLRDEKEVTLDTVGNVAGSKANSASNNVVSNSKLVWLGFGGGYESPTYVDDIVVYRSATAENRNVSAIPPLSLFPQSGAESSLAPLGARYSDTIPDTLDLAERMNLAVSGLTGFVASCSASDPWCAAARNPVSYKHARALPLLRAASGNASNLAADVGFLKYNANNAWYNRAGIWAFPYMGHSEAGTALAIANWFVRDSNPDWLVYMRHISDGISASAQRSGNRAYFPPGEGARNTQTGVWGNPVGGPIPYTSPAEPWIDQLGNEGTVKWENGFTIRALVLDYRESGKSSSLSDASAIKNFLLKPGLWDQNPASGCVTDTAQVLPDMSNYCPDYSKITSWNGYQPKYPGEVQGTFSGQMHGALTALQGLLNYAIAANDASTKQFVKKGIDHAINVGLPKLGWVPYWFPPGSWKKEAMYSGHAEVGSLGDVVVLAVSATDAGLADYWDYVDTAVRNALIESQITSAEAASDPALNSWAGRFFGSEFPAAAAKTNAVDSDANAAIGLFYAWDAAMRYDNETAIINMSFNKAARWGDVYSSVPYQGHIEYKNKWAKRVKIRVPGYVSDFTTAVVRIDGAVTSNFSWSGRYVVVNGLQPGTSVGVSFTLPEETWQFNWNDTPYTAKIRGNTVISISQDGAVGGATIPGTPYKLYNRGTVEQYRTTAPTKSVSRFVSDRDFPLQSEPFTGVYQ